ncbi:MAG: serine hydrolase domain-containing protein [Dehalococcoidia bacterium]|nr:serine hydrolase domain-containing protein [Dehalococcoidia bacterium]
MIKPEYIASKPEDVGVDPERLDAVFARAQRDVDDGTLPSAQVAVARRGKVAGLRAFGRAVQGGSERPATDETLYSIFSCTKAVVASAVWLLFEEGLLRLDERVADIIPEFATNGKDAITVEQALLHIGGFPYAPFHPDHWEDRSKLLEAFSRWRLNWEPGSRFEYHATSAHWVLAEIIYRRTGLDYKTFIRDRITGPMGLDELFIGLPDEYNDRVADVTHVAPPVEPPGGWGEVTPQAIERLNDPHVRRACVPGGGGIAGAGELALFYQMLINRGRTADGTQVLRPKTIDFATTVRTTDQHVEPVFGHPVNRALSVVVAGGDGKAYMRGFGRVVSPRAFGHDGAGGQIAWGDPETGISVGYVTNGFVDWMTQGRRITAISSLAASCAPSHAAK